MASVQRLEPWRSQKKQSQSSRMRKRNPAFLQDLYTNAHNYSLVLPTLVEIKVSLIPFPSAWWPAQSPRRNHQGFLQPRILTVRRHGLFLFLSVSEINTQITYSRFPKPTTTVALSHLPTASQAWALIHSLYLSGNPLPFIPGPL